MEPLLPFWSNLPAGTQSFSLVLPTLGLLRGGDEY